MELPKTSKALLATEVSRLELKLDAGWALHGGYVCAIWSSAWLNFGLGKFFFLFGLLLLLFVILCFFHLLIYFYFNGIPEGFWGFGVLGFLKFIQLWLKSSMLKK